MEETSRTRWATNDTRVYLTPGSELFKDFDGVWFPEADLDSDVVVLPEDYIDKVRIVQVKTRYHSRDSNVAWGEFYSFPLVLNMWGDRVECTYSEYGKLCQSLRALQGMYGMLMCEGKCIGVYNAVIAAWVGPPIDRRIASYIKVPFSESVPLDKALDPEWSRDKVLLIRHRGDVGMIKS